MKEAAATEENVDNQEKDKELEKQIEQETELEKKDEGDEEFNRWINDETQFGPQPEKEVTIEGQPFDTNIFLQSPSHSLLHLSSSSKKTPPKSPSLHKCSPPKDPTPPTSSPPCSNDESSSESSPDYSSPPPSETISKQKSINEPVNPVDLQEQVKNLTTMVTNLAKQVEDFQGTKQQIDKFIKADLVVMIKTYTNDYLMENLVGIITPQVTSLVEPLKDNLEHRIKSVVKKMMFTTPFTLQPAKTSTTTPTATELSFDDLLAQLYDKVAYKTILTQEETTLVDAIAANLSKESCKEAAGSLKRSRKDVDPDPNSKGKKHKSTTGPSSSQIPPKASTPPETQRHTSPTGSGPTAEEEPLMHHVEDYQE